MSVASGCGERDGRHEHSLPPPRAILFDWDNTLVDTWRVIHRSLKVTFEALDMVPWTLEETRQRVRQSAREAFPRVFGERAAEAHDLFYRAIEDLHLDELAALPGAEALLQRLSAQNPSVYLAVVSNKRGDLLRREAAHLGWESHFAKLVGANDAVRDKPAREALDLALAGSGLVPSPAVWFVGDTDIDLRCAHDHGCTAVLVRRSPPLAGEFEGCVPHVHFADCPALHGLLEGLAKPAGG